MTRLWLPTGRVSWRVAGWTHGKLTDTEPTGTGCSPPDFLQRGRKRGGIVLPLLSNNYRAGSEKFRKVKAGLDENHFHMVVMASSPDCRLHRQNGTGLMITAAATGDNDKRL